MSRNPCAADELAVHLAGGGRVKCWARARGIGLRTAYRWSASPEVKALRDTYRRRIVDQAIALLAQRSAGSDAPKAA
jgi:hypothetical protein